MSIDVEVVCDAYLVMKEYVPTKDRQAAADHVASVIADAGISDFEIKQVAGVDSYMKRAMRDYIDEDEDLDEDE